MHPVTEVTYDICKRGLLLGTAYSLGVLAAVGSKPALSGALGVALVLVNFMVAAYAFVWAAERSTDSLTSVVLGSYVGRISTLAGLVWVASGMAVIDVVWLAVTVAVAHLLLLVIEINYLSTTFAHPGLKPDVVGYKPARGIEGGVN